MAEPKNLKTLPTSFPDGKSHPLITPANLSVVHRVDTGSNNSGFYQLNAVLTHKGRSSSSGHYVAWVRRTASKPSASSPDAFHRACDLAEWLMFDDENVTPVKEEDVLKLSGGGDWHTAYLLIYGPRTVEYEEKADEGASGESNVTAMDTTNGAQTTS